MKLYTEKQHINKIITLSVGVKNANIILINKNGDTYEFSSRTKMGEELLDFIILSEKVENF